MHRLALTIRSITNQSSPPSWSHLCEADLNLDFAYRVVAGIRIDLTFKRL